MLTFDEVLPRGSIGVGAAQRDFIGGDRFTPFRSKGFKKIRLRNYLALLQEGRCLVLSSSVRCALP
jgi:hypothetical protein